MLVLVGMDEGDQDLHVGTKYSIIGPFNIEDLRELQQPLGMICYKKEVA